VNGPFLTNMDTRSAGSVFATHGPYRELAINRLPTLILGQPPRYSIFPTNIWLAAHGPLDFLDTGFLSGASVSHELQDALVKCILLIDAP